MRDSSIRGATLGSWRAEPWGWEHHDGFLLSVPSAVAHKGWVLLAVPGGRSSARPGQCPGLRARHCLQPLVLLSAE